MMARVRSVISDATDSTLSSPNSSTSAKTGTAFCDRIGNTEPASVKGVVMISSPGLGSTAATARCSAEVPELEATACALPKYCANSASKARVSPPMVEFNSPLRSTRRTASASSAPILRPDASLTVGSGVVLTGWPPWMASCDMSPIL